MKIGILTFHSQLNYGGVLQCWALQTVLEKLGHEVVVLDRWWDRENERLYGPYKHFSIRQWIGFIKRSIFQTDNGFGLLLRRLKTIRFIHKYLNLSAYHFYDWKDAPADLGIRIIVVGSDQVWRHSKWDDPAPYLVASRNDIPKIAYAVSFGMMKIAPADVQLYANALSKFSAVSCREMEGVRLCKSLNVNAVHMPDPTLLLSMVGWRSMAQRKGRHGNIRHRKLLVCYFLAVDAYNFTDELEMFSREQRCDVEIFMRESMNINAHKRYETIRFRVSAGPLEFVKAMSESCWVITDSFHGLMFSSIFDKNVRILRPTDSIRQEMFSRIEEFSKKYVIGECLCDNVCGALNSFRLGEELRYDYKGLEQLRFSAIEWLKGQIK